MSSAYQQVPNDQLKPGRYICVPHGTLHNFNCEEIFPEHMIEESEDNILGIWIVDVFKEPKMGLICYKHPVRSQDFVCDSTSHRFYGPIK